MLASRLSRNRIENFTTGSSRNARIAATATGISTGCKNEIPFTIIDPTSVTTAAMARNDRAVTAAQKNLC